MIGRPSVMLTPERSFHFPVAGSISKPSSLTGIWPLVVVVRDHRVVLPGAELDEDRIARDGADHIQPAATASAMTGAATSIS